jgi:tRNA(fMet)-specific endonuclease VapC
VILYLLDTNIISYMLMGKSRAARAKLKSLRDNEVACVSTVTEGELRYALAKNPRSQTRTVLYGFLNRLRVFPWGRDEPAVYGESRAQVERTGKTLGDKDLMIAAHAISRDAVLVTRIDPLPRCRSYTLPSTGQLIYRRIFSNRI